MTRVRGRFRRTRVCAVLGALATLGVGPSALADAAPWVLENPVGRVEVGTGVPPLWRAAEAGDVVIAGEAVRTGPRSKVELHTPGGEVRIYENSLLRIPDAARGNAAGLEVEAGRSLFDVSPRSEERFDVETPEVIASVKGTRFFVSLEQDGATYVSVFEGAVAVLQRGAPQTSELLVRAGFTAWADRAEHMKLWRSQLEDPWEGWHAEDGRAPSAARREDRARKRVRRAVREVHRSLPAAPDTAFDTNPEPDLGGFEKSGGAERYEDVAPAERLDPIQDVADPTQLEPLLAPHKTLQPPTKATP